MALRKVKVPKYVVLVAVPGTVTLINPLLGKLLAAYNTLLNPLLTAGIPQSILNSVGLLVTNNVTGKEVWPRQMVGVIGEIPVTTGLILITMVLLNWSSNPGAGIVYALYALLLKYVVEFNTPGEYISLLTEIFVTVVKLEKLLLEELSH
jgi:hypothetical protein